VAILSDESSFSMVSSSFDMEFDKGVVLLVFLHAKLKKYRRHRFWSEPRVNSRWERGIFYAVFNDTLFSPPTIQI
jgi:hypothetical protein